MNRIIFICLVLALFQIPASVNGQTYKKFMKQGNRHYKAGYYEKAINYYKKALKLRKGNVKATYQLGLSYLYSSDELPALEHLRKVYFLDPKIDKHIEYQLGLAYTYHMRFEEARQVFERYSDKRFSRKTDVDMRIRQCATADSLSRHPLNVEIDNLTDINSRFNDYTPLIMDGGNTLVFTSNRPGSTGGIKLYDGSYYEDIYIAKKHGGAWGSVNKVGTAVNVKYHDAAGSISPDGRFLYMYYEYGGGNIYTSRKNGNYFDEPIPLSEEINSVFWETSATITGDGNTLYFASDRPGGFGGLDIYRSERRKDGEWGPAVNLGDKINTANNEDAPYITPDGTRLYFGSSGHPGMGGEDIYYVDLDEGRPGAVMNMGYPINSVFNDNYFMPTEDLSEGYFASMRPGGLGAADMYHVSLKPEKRAEKNLMASNEPNVASPEPVSAPAEASQPNETVYYDKELLKKQESKEVVTVLRGKVIDANTGDALQAELKLVDNTSNRVLARVQTDPSSGDFELVIPHGGNFGVSTRKEGYLFNSLNFELPEFQEFQEIDTHILMRRAEAGSKIILKNIFFDFGRSDLRTESLAELDRILELLEDNPNLIVQINGHTDNVGNSLANKILSRKRAESVVGYLISRGIASERLSAKGYGEEQPLVSNDDEIDGREINRRTEIEIIRNESGT